MRQWYGVFLVVLLVSVAGYSDDLTVPDEKVRQSETFTAQDDPALKILDNNKGSIVSTYKVNYFAMNNWFGSNSGQIKLQFSLKFRVLKPNLYFLKYNIFPAYIAFTQKSLWNVGQPSLPFEENNYNPEFFLDYPLDVTLYKRLKLRNVIISPIEHESNGLDLPASRSWNRKYVMASLGLEPKDKLDPTSSFIPDRARLSLKLWHASGYSDQDGYLESVGIDDHFLDYMGYGMVGLSVRNFLWTGRFKNHQLDIQTPIFHDLDKNSVAFEFRQQIPNMNFALYIQYWLGYGETLMKFDQFVSRGFVGLSFYY